LSNPFKHINAISNHEKQEIDESYNQFLINRFFSYHIDTILYAAEAASFCQDIDNSLHREYYLNSVKKRKRYSKWYKSEKEENLEIISEYYNCSINKAMDILRILSEEQLEYLKKMIIKLKGD
jgi:hypothetical protein